MVWLMSALCGIMAFIATIWFLDFIYAFSFSLLFMAGLVLVLPIALWFEDRKYKNLSDEIDSDILAMESVNFIFNNITRNGYFILTENYIYLISRDKKPYFRLEINKDNIFKIVLTDYVNFNIFLDETQVVIIKSGKPKDLISALSANNWIK